MERRHIISDSRLREVLGDKYKNKTKDEWDSWLWKVEYSAKLMADELSGSKKQYYDTLMKRIQKEEQP